MSHWAEIDETGLVLRVLVGDNDLPDEGESFMNSLGGTWIKTSYNGTIRKNFAGIGFTYNETLDAFIAPRPEKATGFDEETCQWITEVENETDEL